MITQVSDVITGKMILLKHFLTLIILATALGPGRVYAYGDDPKENKRIGNDKTDTWVAWMGSPIIVKEMIRKEFKKGTVYIVCRDTMQAKEYLRTNKITTRPVRLMDMKNDYAMSKVR